MEQALLESLAEQDIAVTLVQAVPRASVRACSWYPGQN
jgi:hypothetical protein